MTNETTQKIALPKNESSVQLQVFTLNAKVEHTIINHISLTWTDLAYKPSCALSSHLWNSELPIRISHFFPRIVQVHSTPSISDSTLRLICSSQFDPPPCGFRPTTFLFPSLTSRLKLLQFLWFPPHTHPASASLCGWWTGSWGPWWKTAVLTHLFDKLRVSAGKKLGLGPPPSYFHLPTRLMSWVTAQHSDTCFTYDAKSEGRRGNE